MLLQCQQRRASRHEAELARRAAEAEQTRAQADAARATLQQHASQSTEALRREYQGLVGRSIDPLAFQALRGRERQAAERLAQLQEEQSLAADKAGEAHQAEADARQRSTESARHLARREHIHDATVADARRHQAKRDASREEDDHAMLQARHP